MQVRIDAENAENRVMDVAWFDRAVKWGVAQAIG
jgi:hypothetical protein